MNEPIYAESPLLIYLLQEILRWHDQNRAAHHFAFFTNGNNIRIELSNGYMGVVRFVSPNEKAEQARAIIEKMLAELEQPR